jgi:hypothetical protein
MTVRLLLSAVSLQAGDHDMGKYLGGIGNVLGLEALTAKAMEIKARIDAKEQELLTGVQKMASKVAKAGDDPLPDEALAPAPVPAPAAAVYQAATAEALIAEVPVGLGTAAPVVAAAAGPIEAR